MIVYFSYGCNDNHDEYTSIVGEWHVEDNGEVTYYRPYDVSIQRTPYDSDLYIIRNLYKLGINSEVYCHVDTTDLIMYIDEQIVGNYSISGEGTIQSDFLKINLSYQVSGGSIGYESVESLFYRD